MAATIKVQTPAELQAAIASQCNRLPAGALRDACAKTFTTPPAPAPMSSTTKWAILATAGIGFYFLFLRR